MGILLGVKVDLLELEDCTIRDFSIEVTIKNRISNFRWAFVVVYGPTQHNLSNLFLDELDLICNSNLLPLVIGGDFNLIRNMEEKNSDNFNHTLVAEFNNFTGRHHLRKVKRSGMKFTWTNKKDCPIQVTLDRFFMTCSWENQFPLCSAWSLTRVGSDHCPIILDSGEQGAPRPRHFFFENKWILHPDFHSLISQKWAESSLRRPSSCSSLDV